MYDEDNSSFSVWKFALHLASNFSPKFSQLEWFHLHCLSHDCANGYPCELRSLNAFQLYTTVILSTSHGTFYFLNDLYRLKMDAIYRDISQRKLDLSTIEESLYSSPASEYSSSLRSTFSLSYFEIENWCVPKTIQFHDNKGQIHFPNLIQDLILFNQSIEDPILLNQMLNLMKKTKTHFDLIFFTYNNFKFMNDFSPFTGTVTHLYAVSDKSSELSLQNLLKCLNFFPNDTHVHILQLSDIVIERKNEIKTKLKLESKLKSITI